MGCNWVICVCDLSVLCLSAYFVIISLHLEYYSVTHYTILSALYIVQLLVFILLYIADIASMLKKTTYYWYSI